MIRYTLLSVFLAASVSGLFAQETIRLKLQPGASEKKEIRIIQPYSDGIDNFSMFLKVDWVTDAEKNNIILTFDRTNSEGKNLILCFPLMKNSMSTNSVKAFNSLSKQIWRGKSAKSIRQMEYFFQSDDVEKNYNDYYRYVAVNNEEEFDLGNVGDKKNLFISLNNLYVIREEKRPWYLLSKRDMKMEYRAEPINLEIVLETDPCLFENNIALLEEAKEKIIELEAIKEKAEEVVRVNRNCSSQLRRIFEEVEYSFPLEQPAWSSSNCNEVQVAFFEYQKIRTDIFSQRCRSAPATGDCPDLQNINKQLMSLQMEIYSKKREGKSVENEKAQFLTIKNDTDKKITSSCDKNLLDSYRSFCAYIEDALNK